jgi:hypothetical protein
MCGRSFESMLFLASNDVDVICPELCCVESRKKYRVLHFWGGGLFGSNSYGI